MNTKRVMPVAVSLAVLSASVAAADPPRPNLLLLFVDNVGYGDLGGYGNHDAITPRIDRLASEGVRCLDFYIASPSCPPSRGAILTGRHPERNGLNYRNRHSMPRWAYEGSLSLRKTEPQDRRIGPWDVRRAAYWGVFAGGCGHTYGHRSFIGWIRKGETYRFGAHIPWYDSLDAFQMGHLRRLMESLPDPLQRLAGDKWRAAWFDPREGTSRLLSEIVRRGTPEFTPPTQGERHDRILVLNDASRNFQLPR